MFGDQQAAIGVKEGDILVGKYRIDKVLGVGGMGVVVAAHHVQLDERVAIKFMRLHALINRDAVGRFAREARAAVKIKSEHVCRVSDVGTLENGAPYMVMEHLEGIDLAAWLQQRGALPVEQAVDFVLQACEAIAEAHTLGIIHRDLKPANLFVIRRPDGVLSIKVLDFGISKTTSAAGSGSDMTQTATIMGSPLYMSPEQMQSSRDVDPRADLWALGVILYELLCAQLPFAASTMPELVLKVVSAPHTPLRQHRADLPLELEQIIGRCLEKDRNRRFESVGALAGSLLPFCSRRARVSVERISGILQGVGMSMGPLVASLPPSEAAPVLQGTQSNFGKTTGTGSRARVWLIALVVLVTGAVTAGALLKAHSQQVPKSAAADPLSAPLAAPAAVKPELPAPAPVPPVQASAPAVSVASAASSSASSSASASAPEPSAAPLAAKGKGAPLPKRPLPISSKPINAAPPAPALATAAPTASTQAPAVSKPAAGGLFNDRN
ncbi:MAG TPA: serine/threonine-protein kinase [Polyangiaceae bacterium]|nr:serine/threonine-protein kinase [Polyangiaceae bacterium]